MNKFMKCLTSPLHLYTAKLEGTPVAVFIGMEMVGSGKIIEITEESVKIGDDYFFRKVCTFKYCVN